MREDEAQPETNPYSELISHMLACVERMQEANNRCMEALERIRRDVNPERDAAVRALIERVKKECGDA